MPIKKIKRAVKKAVKRAIRTPGSPYKRKVVGSKLKKQKIDYTKKSYPNDKKAFEAKLDAMSAKRAKKKRSMKKGVAIGVGAHVAGGGATHLAVSSYSNRKRKKTKKKRRK